MPEEDSNIFDAFGDMPEFKEELDAIAKLKPLPRFKVEEAEEDV